MFRAQAMHQAQAMQQARAIKVSIILIYMKMKSCSSTHTFFITTQVNQSSGVGVEPNMSPMSMVTAGSGAATAEMSPNVIEEAIGSNNHDQMAHHGTREMMMTIGVDPHAMRMVCSLCDIESFIQHPIIKLSPLEFRYHNL